VQLRLVSREGRIPRRTNRQVGTVADG